MKLWISLEQKTQKNNDLTNSLHLKQFLFFGSGVVPSPTQHTVQKEEMRMKKLLQSSNIGFKMYMQMGPSF